MFLVLLVQTETTRSQIKVPHVLLSMSCDGDTQIKLIPRSERWRQPGQRRRRQSPGRRRSGGRRWGRQGRRTSGEQGGGFVPPAGGWGRRPKERGGGSHGLGQPCQSPRPHAPPPPGGPRLHRGQAATKLDGAGRPSRVSHGA